MESENGAMNEQLPADTCDTPRTRGANYLELSRKRFGHAQRNLIAAV
jgi:hypothetical protein